MSLAVLSGRVFINKTGGGYNEALSRCSSMFETAPQFLPMLKSFKAWL
ncbi:MAG: hypothetical protein PHC92_05685 [Syntrophomonadaceae bacterium]|nr:hypothetical protein [Syntrophomonadaceae bacterium]